MNFSQLTKSSSKDQAFVGDLGSRPEKESISTLTIVGQGDEAAFLKRCLDRFAGMEVMSHSISHTGDKMIFSARVKSQMGIPGSTVGRPNALLDIRSQFSGVKFIGIKDGKIEFVKFIKDKIRHFKGELDPNGQDEAKRVEELWDQAHLIFDSMAKFDISG